MRMLLVALLLLMSLSCIGQKEDYVWLGGYNSQARFTDSVTHNGLGITKLDFKFSPRAVIFDSLGMEFSRTCVTYSDTNGQLLFYSNGIRVHNKWDELVENGDSLNAGWYIYDYDNTVVYGPGGGYRQPQSQICIPAPGKNNQYLFFSSFTSSDTNLVIIVNKLLLSSLDMSANSGHGKIIYKNQPIISDTLVWQLSAVRHGNGKDWWLLAQEINSNCFYRILINDNGATVMPDKSCVGGSSLIDDSGGSCFSPNGNKYAVVNFNSGLSLYDFDRCRGTLSNAQHLSIPQIADSVWFIGVAFSPNSRFLYLAATNYCFQFDTWASDVWGSIDTVADRDTLDQNFVPQGYTTPQLAPDGRIYIDNGSTESNYHVIDSPDMKGKACAFRKHGLYTPTFQHTVPNFQNYRLGRLAGSVCDTLSDLMEIKTERLEIQVQPNPLQNFFMVDYGLVDWNRHDALTLKVTDITGQIVYSFTLPRYSALHKVNSASWASGMYLVEILGDNGRILIAKKIVKQE